jgi:uncharacterized membrane protein
MGHRIVEAVGVGTALGTFGYMALRAHWNHLGVTTLAGLGFDRYVMETYNIVAGELPYLLLFLAVLALISGALLLLHRALRRNQRVELMFRRLELPLRRAVPFVLLLLLAAAQLRLMQVLTGPGGSRCGVDVALGNVVARQASHCYEHPAQSILLYLLLAVCAIAFFAARTSFRTARTSTQRLLAGMIVAAAIIVGLQLPMLYGRGVKLPRYPAARITLNDQAATSLVGLVVMQTTGAIELWTIDRGIGQMLVIPQGEIRSMRIGEMRDLFKVARAVAVEPSTFAKECGL